MTQWPSDYTTQSEEYIYVGKDAIQYVHDGSRSLEYVHETMESFLIPLVASLDEGNMDFPEEDIKTLRKNAEEALNELKYQTLIADVTPQSDPGVIIPAGAKCMQWIRFFWSAKSVDRVFSQVYADFWCEYVDEKQAGHAWHARWIRLRFYWTTMKTMGVFSVARVLRSAWDYVWAK